jgi:hypothetical protein
MRTDPRIEDRPLAPSWGVDEATLARWGDLVPGASVTIAKWSAKHGGEERARYPATAVASMLPAPWVAFEAHWTRGTFDQGLLLFENGDVLHEVFSPIHPYDAFAVYRPDGTLKGWYGNVTYPAFFTPETSEPVLVWNDLFIDVVATPDGRVEVLDEDELEESGLASADPVLHARILAGRDELLARFHARAAPFSGPDHIDLDTST